MTIRHMHIACWISKATNTHSEYVIVIALLPQQWLHERASTLRYTYFVCLAAFRYFSFFVLFCLVCPKFATSLP